MPSDLPGDMTDWGDGIRDGFFVLQVAMFVQMNMNSVLQLFGLWR